MDMYRMSVTTCYNHHEVQLLFVVRPILFTMLQMNEEFHLERGSKSRHAPGLV